MIMQAEAGAKQIKLNPSGGNVTIGGSTDSGHKLRVEGSIYSAGSADCIGEVVARNSAGAGYIEMAYVPYVMPGNASSLASIKTDSGNLFFGMGGRYAFAMGSDANYAYLYPGASPSVKIMGGLAVDSNLSIGQGLVGATATPTKLHLGQNFSNGATRDKLKIALYDDGNTERYGFTVGASGDIKYHSKTTHDFYIANTKTAWITSNGLKAKTLQTQYGIAFQFDVKTGTTPASAGAWVDIVLSAFTAPYAVVVSVLDPNGIWVPPNDPKSTSYFSVETRYVGTGWQARVILGSMAGFMVNRPIQVAYWY